MITEITNPSRHGTVDRSPGRLGEFAVNPTMAVVDFRPDGFDEGNLLLYHPPE
jgi:hypothetical protein